MNRIMKRSTLCASALAALLVLNACSEGNGDSSGTASGAAGGTGVGGSTARMTIVDDFLYAIAEDQIQLFRIETPSAPNPWVKIRVGWDIQTLFPYEDYLLVGAADGIHILDNSDPANPTLVGDLTHARTIDPVVATQGYAYVTLKNDPNASNSVDDQMNVVSLADITNPQLVEVFTMQSPEGLTTIDNRLFVCDGPAGIKQYNLDNPAYPVYVDVLPDVNCNDVIALNGILYAITDTRLQLFDYSVSPPAKLSTIDTESMSADALVAALSSHDDTSKLQCAVSLGGC